MACHPERSERSLHLFSLAKYRDASSVGGRITVYRSRSQKVGVGSGAVLRF